jgi:hypothetical protein
MGDREEGKDSSGNRGKGKAMRRFIRERKYITRNRREGKDRRKEQWQT